MKPCESCEYINQYNDRLRKRSNWVEHPRFLDIANEGDYYNCNNCRYNEEIDEYLKRKRQIQIDRLMNKTLNPMLLIKEITEHKKVCNLFCIPFKLNKYFSKEQIEIIKKYKLEKVRG